MNGQWIGSYEGDNNCLMIANIDNNWGRNTDIANIAFEIIKLMQKY